MTTDQIEFLLGAVKKYPEIYNNVARWLYRCFDISSAGLTLLMAYYVIDHLEEDKR